MTKRFYKYTYSLLAFILGFWSGMQLYGKKVGAEGTLPNVRFHINGHLVSPHHWMVDPIYAFIIWYLYKKLNRKIGPIGILLIFFLLGMASQGFTYSDWYVIYDQPVVSNIALTLTLIVFVSLVTLVVRDIYTQKDNLE